MSEQQKRKVIIESESDEDKKQQIKRKRFILSDSDDDDDDITSVIKTHSPHEQKGNKKFVVYISSNSLVNFNLKLYFVHID